MIVSHVDSARRSKHRQHLDVMHRVVIQGSRASWKVLDSQDLGGPGKSVWSRKLLENKAKVWEITGK